MSLPGYSADSSRSRSEAERSWQLAERSAVTPRAPPASFVNLQCDFKYVVLVMIKTMNAPCPLLGGGITDDTLLNIAHFPPTAKDLLCLCLACPL